ncbi:ATP phosphoribosyltransferase regulatory subunit [Bacillus sp. FJAT-50079]|uniref:ATP phosphoribosyltransferase regulatory subunit n=1 Tax=Bacillus sp. FJAT-50079 TaxID=2833577 RepID=UPI001BC9D77A|nr:ATP phosphoribosyltransferase regulatory subunit [Bacillus sp. FJAT-50079]MBS4209279.1 ATP phosphoribosyltransferase regulatory subunit [Bacillus sp. FJAT-50079]
MFLPAGSKDEMGVAVSSRFHVIEKFRKVATLRGYNEISTPVIEYASTFTNEYVDMKLQNMMKWFNSEGEIEVLRPDWTTAIARALSNQEKYPQKWAYAGSVFKQNMPGVEHYQAGVEMIHMPELMGEGESLLMAQSFLKELNVGASVIELGHAGIYEQLASELTLSRADHERLRIAMHDKKKDEVFQIAAANGDKKLANELASLVDAFGQMEIITEYEKRWENKPELLNMLLHLKKLVLIIKESGNEEILVDLGRVKNLPYYSGIMFRGFLKQSSTVCFSGGRYDQLYDQFQEQVSAVGLAFEVDVLAEQIQIEKSQQKICIIAEDDSLVFAEQLRSEFADCIVDVQPANARLDGYDKVFEITNKDGKLEVLEK